VLVASASPGVVTAVVVASYLIGTFPTALLVGRRRGVDPTRTGSRNPGATNIARTAGRRAGVATLVGDLAKGVLAAGIGWAAGGQGLAAACGLAAVVGHVLPVTRGFRGGKGVATGAGMALVVAPAALGVAAVVFAATVGLSRTVSLGSVVGAAVLPVAAAALGSPGDVVAALAVCAVLIVARHWENLRRIAHGDEHRLGSPG
jgi:acyl phosphate:glycerol-3-phosphate acyltransferase